MRRVDYKTGSLIITTVCAFALCISTSYFAWKSEQVGKELEVAQNNCAMTLNELTAAQEQIADRDEKFFKLNKALTDANNTIADLKSTEYEIVYMGEFKLTYYCDGRYPHVCGGSGVTASGKPTEVGVTVAVDKSVIPLGSTVYIEGIGFMEAQDTGNAVIGNHIDILVEDHYTAEQLGINNGGVWVLIKK